MQFTTVIIIASFTIANSAFAQNDLKAFDPSSYLQQKSFELDEAAPSANPLQSRVVDINGQKYLKIQGQQGALYLAYLGDITKEDIANGACLNLHKHTDMKETITEEYAQTLEVKIQPKINLYASFIVKTIKDKCSKRTETFYLPENPAEIGIGIKQGNKRYKIYNRIDPGSIDPKTPEKQLHPGVGFGTDF